MFRWKFDWNRLENWHENCFDWHNIWQFTCIVCVSRSMGSGKANVHTTQHCIEVERRKELWFIRAKLRNKQEKRANSNNQTQRINPLDHDFYLFYRLENRVYVEFVKVEMFVIMETGWKFNEFNIRYDPKMWTFFKMSFLFLCLVKNFMKNS